MCLLFDYILFIYSLLSLLHIFTVSAVLSHIITHVAICLLLIWVEEKTNPILILELFLLSLFVLCSIAQFDRFFFL